MPPGASQGAGLVCVALWVGGYDGVCVALWVGGYDVSSCWCEDKHCLNTLCTQPLCTRITVQMDIFFLGVCFVFVHQVAIQRPPLTMKSQTAMSYVIHCLPLLVHHPLPLHQITRN